MSKPIASEQTAGPKIGIRSALIELFRYVSPRGDRSVMARIIIAFAFVALARAATLVVPIFYGQLVDHVSGEDAGFDLSVMWWLLGA